MKTLLSLVIFLAAAVLSPADEPPKKWANAAEALLNDPGLLFDTKKEEAVVRKDIRNTPVPKQPEPVEPKRHTAAWPAWHLAQMQAAAGMTPPPPVKRSGPLRPPRRWNRYGPTAIDIIGGAQQRQMMMPGGLQPFVLRVR